MVTVVGIFIYTIGDWFNIVSRVGGVVPKIYNIVCTVIFLRFPFIEVISSMPFWLYFGIISWYATSLFVLSCGIYPYFSVLYLVFLYSLFVFGSLKAVRRVLYYTYHTYLNTLIFLHHFVTRNDNIWVGQYEITQKIRNFICVVYSITVYVVFMLPQLNDAVAAIPFFLVVPYLYWDRIMHRVYHIFGKAAVVYAESQLEFFLFLNAFVRAWEFSYDIAI